MRPKQPLSLPAVDPQQEPWVEPGLDSFTEFVTTTEARLRIALSAAHGLETGREAAAEALAYNERRFTFRRARPWRP